MKKKFSILIFSIVGLCLLSLGVSVFTTHETAVAETGTSQEDIIVLNPTQNITPGVKSDSGATGSTYIPFIAGEGALDSYYNMSDEILIMTENQSTQGLCWNFAANKVLETFYAKHFGEYYNLSETWVELAVKKYGGSSYTLGGGGNSLYYEDAINYYGIAMESQVPYEEAIQLEGQDSNYSEHFTYYQQYANTDMLQNIEFDYYGNYNQAVGTSQYDEIKNNIKHYLKNYGSMYVSVKSAEFETNIDGSTYICSLSTSYDSSSGLHAISIIGWDDNYEADGHTGAWLALNSWGVESQKIVHVMYDDV
ncbi:MAG: hypothetical protein IJA22_01995, partial [Clostridia bacterium]|nr:hypothetical protein [Clostridia bacterium]